MLSILHPAPIDTINSSPLQSPRKFSPRRLEWSFVFIESGLEVIQQDNTRPSTSLNTFIDIASPETTFQRTRVERLVPLQTHTAATHISADNKYSPASKTADLTKTAPRSIVGQLLRSLKHSTSIDFLPLFHIKHRLKSSVLPPLSPSDLPPRHPAVKRQGV